MSPPHAGSNTVQKFRQIVLWPLLVVPTRSDPDRDAILDDVTNELEQVQWKWADNPESEQATQLSRLGWYEDDQDYSEITYFHSYARDFLYGGDGEPAKNRPMRVFRRTDLHKLRLELKGGERHEFKVVRAEAYLFRFGVLLLAVELVQASPLTLEQALDLQNVLRMVFPRRWKNGIPKETPLRACWLDAAENEIPDSVQDFKQQQNFLKLVRDQAELPAAQHWRYLFKPLPLYGEQGTGDRYAVKQIIDQRIPSMVYLAVDDPRAISDWDYARIAFLDGAGESSVGAYSDDFLKDWAKTYAYDRFWQRTPSAGGPEVEKHNNEMTTRWLCSGYGFAVVGSDKEEFFTTQIAANFRHHYFRMGLIAHFHRAAVLMFRDQLAEATQERDEKFRDEVQAIQQKMTEFRAQFWFREVSTQLQGQEIFKWWSDRLDNPALFDEVAADIAAAETQVRTELQAEEAKAIGLITRVGLTLSVVGLIVALLALEAMSPDKKYAILPTWDVDSEGLGRWVWRIGLAGALAIAAIVAGLIVIKCWRAIKSVARKWWK